MNIAFFTVKKFYTTLAILGCVVQSSTACATSSRNPASPTDGTQAKITIAAKPEAAKEKQQPKTPALILDNKQIFDKLSRPVEGPRTGGGGNSCALAITQNTTTLVELLNRVEYSDVLEEKKMEHVLSKIKKARFYLQDNLVINGQTKDAVNFPDQNVIYVSPKLCSTELIEASGRAMSLLFHEYLGLARIDDRDYKISGKFLSIYADGNAKNAQTKAWLTNELQKDIEGKRSCFGGAVPRKVKELEDDHMPFHSASLRVEIQPIDSYGQILDDRDGGQWLDKNKKETENEDKAVYSIFHATRVDTYFAVIPFDEWKHGRYDRELLTFKVERKEVKTSLKKKEDRDKPMEGIISSSVKTTYECTPFEFNWEKVGIKDNY
jgi:hypothetical protein